MSWAQGIEAAKEVAVAATAILAANRTLAEEDEDDIQDD